MCSFSCSPRTARGRAGSDQWLPAPVTTGADGAAAGPRRVRDQVARTHRVGLLLGRLSRALQTDFTFIATASDSEHSSFGCADDRDLTYFGEALLKDSLPTTASLEQAFKKAADLIQKRETAEHLEALQSPALRGPAIREKLALIEASGPDHKHGGARHRPKVSKAWSPSLGRSLVRQAPRSAPNPYAKLVGLWLKNPLPPRRAAPHLCPSSSWRPARVSA